MTTTNANIDRLVAERVMGWEWSKRAVKERNSKGYGFWITAGWVEKGKEDLVTSNDFSPTSDPGHCRMVEDKMIDEGKAISAYRSDNQTGIDICWADDQEIISTEAIYGDDYCLCFCLAALKAVMDPDEFKAAGLEGE